MEFEEIDISSIRNLVDNKIRVARIINDEGFYIPYLILSNGIILMVKKGNLLIKKQVDQKCGYKAIDLTLSKNNSRTFLVHRLIASAFIPNPYNKPQVNHIDGVKTNNDVSNLEWNTAQENMDHGWRMGLHKARYGDESYNPKISSKEAKKICKLLEENELTLDEIAEKVGTTRLIVYNIKHKLAWNEISDKYMVENHTVRADGTMRMTKEIAHAVCKDLEENKLCTHEIAEKYGVSTRSVGEIYEQKTHLDVSSQYNIRNHTIRPNVDKKNMDKVKDICALLQDTDLTIAEIAEKVDAPKPLCYRILYRKAWKHISNVYDFSHRNVPAQ